MYFVVHGVVFSPAGSVDHCRQGSAPSREDGASDARACAPRTDVERHKVRFVTVPPSRARARRWATLLGILLLGLVAFVANLGPSQLLPVEKPSAAVTDSPATQTELPADGPATAKTGDEAPLNQHNQRTDAIAGRIVSAEIITTVLISQAPDGASGDADSLGPSLSLDGSRVVFTTRAQNLTPGSTVEYESVVLADRAQNALIPIAVAPDGQPANAWSGGAALSGDGRYVAFYSWANNLVTGDTNGVQDVFLRTVDDGAVVRISVADDGRQANDRSGASLAVEQPALSVDGRYIAFESLASNLAPGDANGVADVFVHDRVLGRTQRVSLASDGGEANGPSGQPSISGDGRYVVFRSFATNLAPAAGPAAAIDAPAQVYVHDRETGQTELISRSGSGAAGSRASARPVIAADGGLIAFESAADNLVPGDLNNSQDVFVYDRAAQAMSLISVSSVGGGGNRDSWWPAISADGRFVAFVSAASNLVNGDTNQAYDVFVHDRWTRHTARVSVAVTAPQAGHQADGDAAAPPAISATGRYVAFASEAGNLTATATAGMQQVYVHERQDAPTYTMAGQVVDRSGRAVADVRVFAGLHQASTDAAGAFVLPNLIAGTYTVRPHKAGYAFVPSQQTVSLPYAPAAQSFVAFADGAPPEPFLDLPIPYADAAPSALQALQDTEEGGLIDAWFDHAYPDYGKSGGVTLWDGRTRDTDGYNHSLGCYERRCYDGHDGVDFPYRDPDPATPNVYEPLPIYPAAPGRVAAVVTGCSAGDRRCNGGYGNEVVLYHGNGYFTRYSHLDTVAVTPSQTATAAELTRADSLGVMGSTGNSFGMHLHFGVHRDNGNGRWDGEDVDLAVDPFGWLGEAPDPWVVERQGPVSRWLWRHQQQPMQQASVLGSQGATVQGPAGDVVVTLPPGAVDGQLRLDLAPGTRAGPPAAGQRSVGFTFWLRVLDWLQGGAGADPARLALSEPATIAVDISQVDAAHLDLSQLALQRWDPLTSRWIPLPTRLDPVENKVFAQTDRFGNFDLQAPLTCPADALEPDDAYFGASTLTPGASVQRLFDREDDEDWFRLDAEAGNTYVLSARNIHPAGELEMTLYGTDGLSALAFAGAAGAEVAQITLQTAADGAYFLRLRPTAPVAPGCDARYEIQIDLQEVVGG